MTVGYGSSLKSEMVYGSSYVLDWVNVRGVTTDYVWLSVPSSVTLCEVEVHKGTYLDCIVLFPAVLCNTQRSIQS